MKINEAQSKFRKAESIDERVAVYQAFFKGRFDTTSPKKKSQTGCGNNAGYKEDYVKHDSRYAHLTSQQITENPLLVFNGEVDL